MIYYKSTRGNGKRYAFSEAILKGIADDGGLFVPEILPQITLENLKLLQNTSYQEKSIFLLNLFQPDYANGIIRRIIHKAYSSNFDSAEIAPLVHLKNTLYVLELWHGPTSAFKDLALQIMPIFFSEALHKDNKKRISNDEKPLHYLILVATSGDTGKAALEGYKNKKDITIMVFYPHGHVSQLQELQMNTQEGSNVAVYSVDGDFDTTQSLVKDIFNDREFNNRLFSEYQTVVSSANSINWGRLAPQIIYYISSYLDLVDKKVIKLGEKIDIAVPTGNFGNILAAFYVKKMGLPIRKLICASNENNVLTEFLRTGIYDVSNRTLIQTPSPSMDILISSNIERLLFTIINNSEQVSRWMHELKADGKFEVDNRVKAILQQEFYADWVSNINCLQNIKKIFHETNYLMDPHTSVAQAVVEKYLKQDGDTLPMVICSTAHFAKFPNDVYKALKGDSAAPPADEFKTLELIFEYIRGGSVPKSISSLKNKRIRFNKKCNADIDLAENLIIENIVS